VAVLGGAQSGRAPSSTRLHGIVVHSMTNHSPDTAAAKGTIRSRLLAARRECAPEQRLRWSEQACALLLEQIDRVLARPGSRGVVAAYASFGTEPDTGVLLAGLLDRGVRVLLPVLENDGDLAWGWYSGPDSLGRGNGGPLGGRIPEPSSVLDVDAVRQADVVVLPGLAVDPHGLRLGRGGGSYDRVLARLARQAPDERPWTVTLLYPGEAGRPVPAEPHDFAVDAAVTADGLTPFP
jgi:5-formyltetrahydrofolate cyclo-ligase